MIQVATRELEQLRHHQRRQCHRRSRRNQAVCGAARPGRADGAHPHRIRRGLRRRIGSRRNFSRIWRRRGPNYHDEWVSANLVKFFADGFTGLLAPLVYRPERVQEPGGRAGSARLSAHDARDAIRYRPHGAGRLRAGRAHQRPAGPAPAHRAQLLGAAKPISRATRALSVIDVTSPVFCCGESGHQRRPQGPDPERSVADLPRGRRASWASAATGPAHGRRIPSRAFRRPSTREIWHSDDTADIIDLPLDGAAMAGARPTGKVLHPAIARHRAAGGRRLYAGIGVRRVRRQPGGHASKLGSSPISRCCRRTFSRRRHDRRQDPRLMTMVGGRIVYGASPDARDRAVQRKRRRPQCERRTNCCRSETMNVIVMALA